MPGREPAIGHPALTDPATGLANSLHFDLVYGYLFAAADRGVPLTLMLVTSPAPDEPALRGLGARIKDMTRTSDLVAYLGDTCFGVLLVGCNLSGGRLAADRVEMALVEVAIGPVSIGLASFQSEMKEASELFEATNEALRRSEAAGGGLEMVG
jgi:GGDEF domain-containing protein